MSFNRIIWLGLAFVLITIWACASIPKPVAPETKKSPEAAATSTEKLGWEAEWERVQREAKKEGKLVLYTTHGPEVRGVITEALKKYDIPLETVVGRGPELTAKLLRERRAGIYYSDFYLGGVGDLIHAQKPAGILAPLEPLIIIPEVKDPKFWYKGMLPFVDKDKLIMAILAYVNDGIHVNTDKVKSGDINSMQDLLSPIWKGKIVMDDPTISGRGQLFMAVITNMLGEKYVRQLVRQEPFITRDRVLLINWLVTGKYAIALGIQPEEYQTYKTAGAPITNLPLKDISYIGSGAGHLSYYDQAPHPNASRVFANWLLSREGQTRLQEIRVTQSARIDTPVEPLIKAGSPVRQDGKDYYDVRSETWELEMRPKGVEILKEVFSPLVR